MISTKVVASGVSFESLGLSAAKIGTTKAQGYFRTPTDNSIFEISDAALKKLTEKATEKRWLVSDLVIRTLSLQKATITSAIGNENQEKIEVIPRLNSDGTITMDLNLQLGKGPKHQGLTVVYRTKNGSNRVIGRPKTDSNPEELLAVLSARVVKDTDVNP